MSLELFKHLASFPVPDPYIAIGVATTHEFTIGGEARLACIPSNQMARKVFLAVNFESILSPIDMYLII
jgi:hypothetical protein